MTETLPALEGGQYLNWRWTMFINVPIAGIVITGGVIFLSSRLTEARQRVDWAGAVLGGLGLFAVVYGFAHAATKPGSAGWADPQTISSIAAGIVLLAAFVIAERRVAYPLLPLRVVLDRNRGGSYSALLLAPIGLFSVFLFLTYYLETIQGYSPGQHRAGVPAAHRDGAGQRRCDPAQQHRRRRRCELHHRARHGRGSLAGPPGTGGGAQLHRRVLGRCGDLDRRGTPNHFDPFATSALRT